MSLNLRDYASTVRVTDGAWGTELQKLGLPPGSPPEIWNVSKPTAVQDVAESYVKAGSDIIITNTFGANRFILAQHGVESRTAELAEAGAAISKRATVAAYGKRNSEPGIRNPETGTRNTQPGNRVPYSGFQVPCSRPLVFASIGPTGKIVMMEEIAREAFLAAFAETAEAVAFGGADGIVLESFAELDELALAVRACRKATDLPIVASMTFAAGPDQTVTMMGATPAQLAEMARREGASAVGANCGVGPANYVKVAKLLREACDLPIWIKANAGVPTVTREGTKFPMGPDEFASFVPALIEAGANFIGGCCGTTPEHIRAVRKKVDGQR